MVFPKGTTFMSDVQTENLHPTLTSINLLGVTCKHRSVTVTSDKMKHQCNCSFRDHILFCIFLISLHVRGGFL